MHPVSSPDWMSVGINQPCNNKMLMTDLIIHQKKKKNSPGRTHIPFASITLSKVAPEYCKLMASAGPTAVINPSLDKEMHNLNGTNHKALIAAKVNLFSYYISPRI